MLLPLLLPLCPTRHRQDPTGVPSTLSAQQQELPRRPRRRLQQQQQRWERQLRRQTRQIAGGLGPGWDLQHLVRPGGSGSHLLLRHQGQQWRHPKGTTAQQPEVAAVVVGL